MSFEFDEEAHEYRVDGVVYPSVTQILSGLGMTKDLSFLSPFYRQRGTAVHACIRLHLEGHEIDWEFEGADEVLPRFEKAVEFCSDWQLEPIVVEKPMYSALYGYAGTVDTYCWSGKSDGAVVVDWKGSIYDKAYDMQVEAYAELLHENFADVVPEKWAWSRSAVRSCPAYVVTLGSSGKKAGVHEVDRLAGNRELFLAAAAVYNWKKQNVPENGNGKKGKYGTGA